jgi:hypothetical protein
MVFLALKTLLYPSSIGEKLFFPTLNLMILQTVWNECLRFGGHINIQISYKILWLEVLKKVCCTIQLAFKRGVVLRQLWTQRGLRCLQVKQHKYFRKSVIKDFTLQTTSINFTWILLILYMQLNLERIFNFMFHKILIPKVLWVFFIKIASKQPLLKVRWTVQNWSLI